MIASVATLWVKCLYMGVDVEQIIILPQSLWGLSVPVGYFVGAHKDDRYRVLCILQPRTYMCSGIPLKKIICANKLSIFLLEERVAHINCMYTFIFI